MPQAVRTRGPAAEAPLALVRNLSGPPQEAREARCRLRTPSPRTHRLTNHPGGGSPPRLTVKRSNGPRGSALRSSPGPVAQWSEQRTHNPSRPGSNPGRPKLTRLPSGFWLRQAGQVCHGCPDGPTHGRRSRRNATHVRPFGQWYAGRTRRAGAMRRGRHGVTSHASIEGEGKHAAANCGSGDLCVGSSWFDGGDERVTVAMPATEWRGTTGGTRRHDRGHPG